MYKKVEKWFDVEREESRYMYNSRNQRLRNGGFVELRLFLIFLFFVLMNLVELF